MVRRAQVGGTNVLWDLNMAIASSICHSDDKDDHAHDILMPGFLFHPTEEELIEFYLRRKVEGKRFNVELIAFLDLYRYDPWELPGETFPPHNNKRDFNSFSIAIRSFLASSKLIHKTFFQSTPDCWDKSFIMNNDGSFSLFLLFILVRSCHSERCPLFHSRGCGFKLG